jgi:hypothetical protein
MPRPLTLEQVREAERFAWHGSTIDPDGHFDGDLWADGRYVRVDTDQVHVGIGSPTFTTGWHHLPGCDCEFCST